MANNTTIFDCSQPQIIKQASNFVDGRKPGSATAADQQAAAAAAPLKCPRCDSTNTKFCYYNNYSLSQPRHFCKACKRYWTRGGTLRNVPVGGGCRKIKPRVRQPSTKLPSGYRNSTTNLDNGLERRVGSQGQTEDANLMLNDFLYSKNNQNMEIFNGFGASRVTDRDLGSWVHSSAGYNQSNNLGLGFSPTEYMRNQTTDSSNLSSYSNIFGSNFSSPSGISNSAYSPLMQSVLRSSGFEYKKSTTNEQPSSHNKGHVGNFMSSLPLEDMHIDAIGGRYGAGIKDEDLGGPVKLNQMGPLFSQYIDPSLYNWNNGVSNMNNPWSDHIPNTGSSVMSLL